MNRKLADHLGIKEYKPPTSTKYRDAQNHIIDFCRNYLFVKEFNIFKFNSKDFITIPENRITEIPEAANALAFGNNQSDIDPRTGIAEFGPYSPSPRNNVKFFFIAHESDKLLCNKLYQIFKEGCKIENKNPDDPLCKFKPLAEYIKQPFITDKNAHIFFNNPDNAISEIAAELQSIKFDKNSFYIALYITPPFREPGGGPGVRELLLNKNITFQTIDRDSIESDAFIHRLPCIASAILAKIGGIP